MSWGDAVDEADAELLRKLTNVIQIQTTDRSVAAIRDDGSVVTWGLDIFGGFSTHVQDQLKNVRLIQATSCAFAAILDDGSVVTWGEADAGGDSGSVQDQLKTSRLF